MKYLILSVLSASLLTIACTKNDSPAASATPDKGGGGGNGGGGQITLQLTEGDDLQSAPLAGQFTGTYDYQGSQREIAITPSESPTAIGHLNNLTGDPNEPADMFTLEGKADGKVISLNGRNVGVFALAKDFVMKNEIHISFKLGDVLEIKASDLKGLFTLIDDSGQALAIDLSCDFQFKVVRVFPADSSNTENGDPNKRVASFGSDNLLPGLKVTSHCTGAGDVKTLDLVSYGRVQIESMP